MENSIQKLAGITAMFFGLVLLVGRLSRIIVEGQTSSIISLMLNITNIIVLCLVCYAWRKIKQLNKSTVPHLLTLIGMGLSQSVIIINHVNVVTNYVGIFVLLIGGFLVYSSGIVYLAKRGK